MIGWLKKRAKAIQSSVGQFVSWLGKSIRDNWWWISSLIAGFAVFAIVSLALTYFFPVGIIALASLPALSFLGALSIGKAALVVGAMAFGFTQVVGILVHGGAAVYNAFDRWMRGKKKPLEQYEENEKANINILRELIGEADFKEHVKNYGNTPLPSKELEQKIREINNASVRAEDLGRKEKNRSCCGIFSVESEEKAETDEGSRYYNEPYKSSTIRVN